MGTIYSELESDIAFPLPGMYLNIGTISILIFDTNGPDIEGQSGASYEQQYEAASCRQTTSAHHMACGSPFAWQRPTAHRETCFILKLVRGTPRPISGIRTRVKIRKKTSSVPSPLRAAFEKHPPWGAILNKTYGTHQNLYIFVFFTSNTRSYLLWPPVIV